MTETISGSKDLKKTKIRQNLKKLKKDDILICSEISRLGKKLLQIITFSFFVASNQEIIHSMFDMPCYLISIHISDLGVLCLVLGLNYAYCYILILFLWF